MNKHNIEQIRFDLKLAFRKILPKWFLKLIRRRQVSLVKMLDFQREFDSKKIKESTNNQTIAIIVPCYNHHRYLPLTFESIIKQTCLPDQVVLIDDYSNDNTYQVIQELVSGYQKNNPEKKIEFIVRKNEKNLGQAETINRATILAKTDLVMILNDDDYLMHDAVEITLSLFQKNKNLALIGFSNINFDNNNFLANSRKMAKDYYSINNLTLKITAPSDALNFENYCSLNMTHTGSTFNRAKALSINGYWPKKNRLVRFSDRDFQIRMNLLYQVGTNVELPLCFWRTNSSIDSGRNS